jgi:hypothetical protein
MYSATEALSAVFTVAAGPTIDLNNAASVVFHSAGGDLGGSLLVSLAHGRPMMGITSKWAGSIDHDFQNHNIRLAHIWDMSESGSIWEMGSYSYDIYAPFFFLIIVSQNTKSSCLNYLDKSIGRILVLLFQYI